MANPRLSAIGQFGEFQGSGGGGAGAPAGAFGTRVAPVAPVVPFNRGAAVASVAPLQPNVGNDAWEATQAMLNGGISPGTQKYIRDRAAALGVNIGAAGPDLVTNQSLIGELGTSEDRVKAGLNAYNALLAGTQNLVTDPTQANEFNNEVAQWNNTNAAAPDPAAAAQYQQKLFDDQVKLLSQAYRSPAAGVGRGVTSGAPQYASVASPPNLSAPGFVPQSTPGLLNSATFSNGLYSGGGGRAAPTPAPVLQPSQIRQWGGGGSGYNSLDPGTAGYTGGYDASRSGPVGVIDPALQEWLDYSTYGE